MTQPSEHPAPADEPGPGAFPPEDPVPDNEGITPRVDPQAIPSGAALGDASIRAFIHSRATCQTCGHRRKDHDGPETACRRYDQPDCPCVTFVEAPQ